MYTAIIFIIYKCFIYLYAVTGYDLFSGALVPSPLDIHTGYTAITAG